jgi:hypothetical protein
MPTTLPAVPRLLVAALLCCTPVLTASASLSSLPSLQNDLDELMATVLAHRDQSWLRLHDYVLREKESATLDGPGGMRLFGSEREFSWHMREGFLVRSPLRYDKVTLSEAERRKYEDDWLAKEKSREEEHAKREARKAAAAAAASQASKAAQASPHSPGASTSAEELPVTDVQAFMREGGEPRFISEAYFLAFKFEPGNYYLAGRDTLDGRDVLRIEYYPTRLYDDDSFAADEEERAKEKERQREPRKKSAQEQDFERKFNKVALVTLWVDPKIRQIVKYTFENVDFGFLPGRMLVRVGDVKASMVMSQPFPDTWLPQELSFEADLTLAVGTYEARYVRRYYDYRQGEVRARIRHYDTEKER